MPDFLNPDQAILRDRAESLAQRITELVKAQPPEAGQPGAEEPEDDGTAADLYIAIMAASKEAGIWDLTQQDTVPVSDQENPTSGATPALDLVIVRDALSRRNVGHLAGIFGPAPTLLSGASEPLRTKMLSKYLSGELRGSFGFTEPADATRSTWARTEGDELVVNGQKSYVTGGADAHFINTLVEVENSGPAMVFIETDRPGVKLVRRFGSLDGSHHAAFAFTDVRVPTSHVLGQPGKGMGRALSQISGVRMALAANSVGLCAFVIDLVEQHLGRHSAKASSGKTGSIAGHETARSKLGALRVSAYAARSAVYRTARIIDAGENSVNEVMAAKAIATETVGQLVDEAVQIMGGQALANTHALSEILRRVRSFRLVEGPTDVLYANIARGSLDLDLGRI